MTENQTTETKKPTFWKRVLQTLGAAGVIALLALIQQLTGFTFDDLSAKPSDPQATTTPATTANATPSTESADAARESPPPSPRTTITTSQPLASPTPTPPPAQRIVPSDALSSIMVVSEMTTTTYGKVVGREDNLYQMANGWGHIQVAYGWSGLRADGTEIKSEACQILVTIVGPQPIPSERYGHCTNLQTDFYKADDNKLKISVPGVYKVTVKDEKTGVSGTGGFTILGE